MSGSPVDRRHGLTLIEILVSLLLISIILVIIMKIFGDLAGAVADNRAMIEMVDRQASVLAILNNDLASRTVQTLPWVRDESASGYIEVVEGGGTDKTPFNSSHMERPTTKPMSDWVNPPNSIIGDVDDILMLTVRSKGKPFSGRYEGRVIESHLAEVVWWVAPVEDQDSSVRPLALFRRVLLIRPDLQINGGEPAQFYQQNDVSVRKDDNGKLIANSLADVTHPENRFSHSRPGGQGTGRINLNKQGGGGGAVSALKPFASNSERYGQDLMLTNCVGFDVKIFDPRGKISQSTTRTGDASAPGDFDYSGGNSVGTGAYVDMGKLQESGGGIFAPRPDQASQTSGIQGVAGVYDTWSFHYEHDGISQGRGSTDASTDGEGYDDASERETAPPYPFPLRGLQVKVRSYDPSSRQVRESTVNGDFLPR